MPTPSMPATALPDHPEPRRLLLASTSRYRAGLLARLGLPFEVSSPGTDEAALPGESPAALAVRLAAAKARDVARQHPGAWVIGSDQTAALDAHTLGKPGTHAAARAQLQAMSGRSLAFLTAVAVVAPDGHCLSELDTTTVRFRTLHDAEIERYLLAETPYDCAGSFKSEGLGITLFDAIESSDPSALVGLPLIATARLLRTSGFVLP